MSEQKVNRSIRFEAESLKLADALEIDVNDVARKALDAEIKYRSTKNYSKKIAERWERQQAILKGRT